MTFFSWTFDLLLINSSSIYSLEFTISKKYCMWIETLKFSEVAVRNGLFIKPGIQERGTECGEWGEWAFRGMLKKIPGNAQEDSGECSARFRGMFNKILRNVRKDSGECSKRFRGMFRKIPGNVQEDYGECSKRFRGMLAKILENAQKGWTIYTTIKPK